MAGEKKAHRAEPECQYNGEWKAVGENRYYIKSVVEVIQFFMYTRGDGKSRAGCLNTSNESRGEPPGLFMKLFQYTLSRDKKLR